MNDLQKAIGRISTWGKVTGIFNIIAGALSAIGGLFAYVVGAIPGVITLILGVFLYQIGKQASNLKVNMEDEQSQLALFDYLSKYLFLHGIFIIVIVSFIIIGIIIFVVFSFAAFMTLFSHGM